MNKPNLIIFSVTLIGLFMTLRLSRTGLNRIKYEEGFRANKYRDKAGHWTIGYGHKIKADENFDDGITEFEAETLLRQDTKIAQNAVNKYVSVPLTSGMFDALVSLVFNIGVGAFADSTLLRLLNGGDYDNAFNEFSKWKYITLPDGKKVVDSVLVARREREQQLFTS